jgi:hypothetical protein
MKRQWRTPRLLCATLVLGFAALVWWFWPLSPRWRIASEIVIGFDEAKELLYTKPYLAEYSPLPVPPNKVYPSDWLDVRAYDLKSGRLKFTFQIGTRNALKQWDQWLAILSPDKNLLAVHAAMNGALEVFDLNSRKVQYHLRDSSFDTLDVLGFSPDGQLLATRSRALTEVWDLRSGQRIHRFELPAHGLEYSAATRMVSHDGIQISPDHRYLVVQGDNSYSFLYDLEAHKQIGQFIGQSSLGFLDNEVLLLSSNQKEDGPVTYQISNKQFGEFLSREELLASPRFQGLSVNGDTVVIRRGEDIEPNWLSWLSKESRTKVLNLIEWPASYVEVSSWNWKTATRKYTRRFSYHWYADDNTVVLGGAAVAPSIDGYYLVSDDGKDLSLWDNDSHRSTFCWIICLGFVLLACWVGRPQKVSLS